MKSINALNRIRYVIHFVFFLIYVMIWLNEFLDFPYLTGIGEATPVNIAEAAMESSMIAVLWLITARYCNKLVSKIRVLEGIIPICSHCKKIRNDRESWEQVEQYISENSDALFSHSICPDCLKEFYPELADKVLTSMAKNKDE